MIIHVVQVELNLLGNSVSLQGEKLLVKLLSILTIILWNPILLCVLTLCFIFRMRTFLACAIVIVAFAYIANAAEAAPEGFKIEKVVEVTCDPEKQAKAGSYVSVSYKGAIAPTSATGKVGHVFDSSEGRPDFTFALGEGYVIKGWDAGLEGMCEGESRILTIPPEWGYGSEGAGGDIPGGATLRFEVTLKKVEKTPPPERNMFATMDTNADGLITREEIKAFFIAEFGVPEGEVDHVIEEVMATEDQNKDGSISWDEFTGPKGTERPAAGGAPKTDAAAAPAAAPAAEKKDEL